MALGMRKLGPRSTIEKGRTHRPERGPVKPLGGIGGAATFCFALNSGVGNIALNSGGGCIKLNSAS